MKTDEETERTDLKQLNTKHNEFKENHTKACHSQRENLENGQRMKRHYLQRCKINSLAGTLEARRRGKDFFMLKKTKHHSTILYKHIFHKRRKIALLDQLLRGKPAAISQVPSKLPMKRFSQKRMELSVQSVRNWRHSSHSHGKQAWKRVLSHPTRAFWWLKPFLTAWLKLTRLWTRSPSSQISDSRKLR